ncbi:protein FpvR [Steroidobacter agaridevorans]|uniref:Protein FpvR n=1 Tax=Steroidobacter agaridevorans TaxID=2695856 RepID=A0A829YGD4_9GAMM|nr:FecR domain-containing protein [Steroidobacter agaridevorans]GFE82319.1 protein FpvR [Steroidobacter agaridevorans]GFE85293.1 protein FpvR [Steroidobacter agaridevorans]
MSDRGLKTNSSSDIRAVEAAAARWFVRLHDHPVSRETEAEFDAWLDQAAEHRECYMRCELVMAMGRGLATEAELQADIDFVAAIAAREAAAQERSRRFREKRSIWFSAAATVLLMVATGAYFFTHHVETQIYQTQVGEQRRVVLADHSTVTLNTDTVLTVKLSDQSRRIEMQRGEAFFSVAHDTSRPFEVIAAGGLVRAVGTEFGVQMKRDGVTVSVLEGAVVVLPKASDPVAGVPHLTANMAVSYRGGGGIGEVQAADVRRITAWREGKLVFDQVPLADAIAEFNRYSPRKVQVSSASVGSRPVSGVLQIGDMSSLRFLLQESLGLKLIDQGDTLLLQAAPESNETGDARR